MKSKFGIVAGHLAAAALAASAGLALAASAHAGVIFSDFGPGDSYDPSNGWTVSGATVGCCNSPGFAFQSSGNYDVTQIDLALGYLQGTNEATVTLWTDILGARGSQLGSWNVSGQPPFGSSGGSGALTSISISGVHLVAGGSYFLQVAPFADDTWDAWYMNSTAYVSEHLNYDVPGGETRAGAFDVIGNTGGVPEPATWAIMLVGFGGLGAVLRRQRRATLAA